MFSRCSHAMRKVAAWKSRAMGPTGWAQKGRAVGIDRLGPERAMEWCDSAGRQRRSEGKGEGWLEETLFYVG